MKAPLVALIIFQMFTAASAQPVNISLCIIQENLQNCEKLKQLIPNIPLECIPARDRIECMHKVKDGIANIVNLGSNEAYTASTDFSLMPLLEERANNENFMYEGVAVVKKNLSINLLSDLKGKKSCHTGYGRNAGWDIPIALLSTSTKNKCGNDLELASNLFSQSCVPGAWSVDPQLHKTLKTTYSNLCQLCSQKCTLNENENENYIGYEGALKCLLETSADIAFTKHVTVIDFMKNNTSFASNYNVLCSNGSSLNLNSNCYLAARPNPLIVVHRDLDNALKIQLKNQTQQLFQMLISQNRNYLKGTFLSSSKSTELKNTLNDVTEYLNQGNYKITMDKVLPKSCMENYTRLCVTNDMEKRKCQDIRSAAFASRLRPLIVCIEKKNEDECFQAIQDNQADIRIVDAYGLYKGYKKFNLQSVLGEIHSNMTTSDYAIVIIKNNSGITKLSDLKGRKACFPSVFDSTGWFIPMITLVKQKLITADTCTLMKKSAEFFSESCAPGAPNDLPSLCKLCKGDKNNKNYCTLNDRYAGYLGALECFATEDAQVAFVSQSSVKQLLMEMENHSWLDEFKNLTLRLLCPNGGIKNITEMEECNWGKIPRKQVVTNKDKNSEELRNMQMMLIRASSMFGSSSSLFKLFFSYEGKNDILFSTDSDGLRMQSDDAISILGKTLSSLFELDECVNRSSNLKVNIWITVGFSIFILLFKKVF